MSIEENKARIREYVARFFKGHHLQDDEDMLATGFVSSMFAMQLVQFVETQLGVTVEPEDLDLDNFRSINAIAAFVERKGG
jgi:acyl carrier protein